ncbi:MAG: transglycosylase SLT domain-containing protein [Acidobacteriota bacterium]|nr:transglycosylase SLT domain-containing protein [Acidobacteriota bacterium]
MFHKKIFLTVFAALLLLVPLSTSGCAYIWRAAEPVVAADEKQALENLRRLAKNGLPPESIVAQLETNYPNTKTAALARLLRAQIRLQNNDAAGAATLLDNSNLIRQKTSVGDYALLLRGQALAKAGRNAEAQAAFEQLIRDFPNSLRARDAKLGLAELRKQTGETERVLSAVQDLLEKNDAAAWLIVAQAHEQKGDTANAVAAYRKIYFFAPAASQANDAVAALTRLGSNTNNATSEEILARAEALFAAKKYGDSANAYQTAATAFPAAFTPKHQLNRGIALANLKRAAEAASVFNSIPSSAGEIKAQALSETAKAYAAARLWQQARAATDELRRQFPNSNLTPKTFIAVGLTARDANNDAEEGYYLRTAISAYPNFVEVGQAQFELAWLAHQTKNFAVSSQMLIEHLARYVDKDTTYRGRAGYWAARDSERAGKIAEACFLYNAMLYRYDANWYGYLAGQRLDNLKANRQCPANADFPADSLVGRAAANLKTVTVAPETAGTREADNVKKADELATVALFDWALAELNEAGKTAPNSPKVNLGLARLYRLREDNVSALLALAKSYPDYSQMKPEEMTREEWDIFYPLTHWNEIKRWATARNLDAYTVAGLIRQESVFNPRAKSHANAFGLMQLIMPTARAMARKYRSAPVNSAEDLYNPPLNIELGTAYMRDQLDKYGRIEYLAVAYNAGPGRVVSWRQSLPAEIDEFAEAIPFKETRGYVQGVVRNAAQYRRLYDMNGQFKPNVGTKAVRAVIDTQPAAEIAKEFPDLVVSGDKTSE